MSKTFRKEGQPEKERIAKIIGMDIDKISDMSFFLLMLFVAEYTCTCTMTSSKIKGIPVHTYSVDSVSGYFLPVYKPLQTACTVAYVRLQLWFYIL